jgi:SAM-dependent methyltransferase
VSVRAEGHEAIWHDVECGAYEADLAIWAELAGQAAGPVLELGCGTGRVALHLAAAGFEVAGLDSSPALIAALRRRASAAGLEVECTIGDARELALERRFALICAPMQLIHLMGGAEGRSGVLRGAANHLAADGAVAVAVLADAAVVAGDGPPPLPDVLERDGQVFSSLPFEVRSDDHGLEVRRLRQVVSATGELDEEVDVTRLDAVSASALERESRSAGLATRERIQVPPTADHVGSTIVVLEAR